jgi:hypothetical protein
VTLTQLSRILPMYGGTLHGQCKELTDIEFPHMRSAAAFVDGPWLDVARFRDPVTSFDVPVVVQIPNDAIAARDLLAELIASNNERESASATY